MKHKTNRHAFVPLFFVLIIAVICGFTACAPFGAGLSEGINEDVREMKAHKDPRFYGDAPDYEAFVYKKGGDSMAFRMRFPEGYKNLVNYDADGMPSLSIDAEKYPLIVFLHGSGDWGNDNISHMYRSLITSYDKYLEETENAPDCFVLYPQAPKKQDWTENGCSDLLNGLLDELFDGYPIDTGRVYLTGMSLGGYGTFYQANLYPDRYAAIMPLCGFTGTYDLSGVSHMPVWLGHSLDDDVVNHVYSAYAYAELQRLRLAAGQSAEKIANEVRLSTFEHEGHQVTQAFYQQTEVWEWLFSFKR